MNSFEFPGEQESKPAGQRVSGLASQREERQGGEFADEADGSKADGDDLADEADDVSGIVLAIWVVEDAGALIGGNAVLVDEPFEGAAVAESVPVDLCRDSAQGEEGVVLELGFVLGERHFPHAPLELAGFGALKRYSGCCS